MHRSNSIKNNIVNKWYKLGVQKSKGKPNKNNFNKTLICTTHHKKTQMSHKSSHKAKNIKTCR